MLSVSPERPLDPVTHAIIQAVHLVANDINASYFIIGATARDILLRHVSGVPTGRATRDVDFAIALENWEQFESIKKAMVASGDFEAASEAHRLYYQPKKFSRAYPLDLIPFGGVEQNGHRIAWPPDMHVVMNVAGYAEALSSSVQVDIGNGLFANLVSIPALAALKLLAWSDRARSDGKDAQDLYLILKHYHHAGNADRLYDHMNILEACGYDVERAGAALLGSDTASILEKTTCDALLALCGDPDKRERLVLHMGNGAPDQPAVIAALLRQFEQGLRQAPPQ